MQLDTLKDNLWKLGLKIGVSDNIFYEIYCDVLDEYTQWQKSAVKSSKRNYYVEPVISQNQRGEDVITWFKAFKIFHYFPVECESIIRSVVNWKDHEADIIRACGLPYTWEEVAVDLVTFIGHGIKPMNLYFPRWGNVPFEEWIAEEVPYWYIDVDHWYDRKLCGGCGTARVFCVEIKSRVDNTPAFQEEYTSNMLLTKLGM